MPREAVITAAMVWYDEPVEQLTTAVQSAASLADRIVALDGAYRRFPDGRPHSPPEQAQAIREAAAASGMDCLVLTPDRLWAGGVEKRNHLFSAACVGSDWLLTLDADWVIHADGKGVRAELAALRHGEVAVESRFITPANLSRPMRQSAAGAWHAEMTLQPHWYPVLFRALPGMRVEQFHYWYSGLINERHGWRRVWLLANDPSNRYPTLPRYQLPASLLEVEHRCLFRDRKQILANRAFCNDREMVVAMTGQEDDMPGLPAPVFDYKRIPQ